MDNVINRRNRIDLYTPAEKAIHEAVQAVEAAGAHPRLTDAVNMLGDAQDAVADYVDGMVTTHRRSLPPTPVTPELPKGAAEAGDLEARLREAMSLIERFRACGKATTSEATGETDDWVDEDAFFDAFNDATSFLAEANEALSRPHPVGGAPDLREVRAILESIRDADGDDTYEIALQCTRQAAEALAILDAQPPKEGETGDLGPERFNALEKVLVNFQIDLERDPDEARVWRGAAISAIWRALRPQGGETGDALTAADLLAWLEKRPGASWQATIEDVKKAIEALRLSPKSQGDLKGRSNPHQTEGGAA